MTFEQWWTGGTKSISFKNRSPEHVSLFKDALRCAWDASHANTLEEVGNQWQPIETAPTDGTLVLLYKPKGKYQGAFTTTGYFKLGWILQGLPVPDVAPTYWMPLPELPEA